jgi:glycosyltransferase involved in cell wall biosynthesis
MFKISVIISTWRRPNILDQVLTALTKQTLSFEHWETIVVDSNSADETRNVVGKYSKFTNFNLRIVDAKINALTTKRNTGLELAKGKFIVFLDDDCIPEEDHLQVFLKNAEPFTGKRVAWSGGVKFPADLVEQSNYYRYRDNCHFSKKKSKTNELHFSNIVAMNLLIEKSLLIEDDIKFNEKFIGYGFEDMQFGIDLVSKQYSLMPCAADIIHQELGGDIKKFMIKMYHAGRDGMPVLKSISPEFVAAIGQTKWLEPNGSNENFTNILSRKIIHLLLDSKLPNIIARILLRFDHNKLFYFKAAYRFVLAGAYREGVHARSHTGVLSKERVNKDGWYT